MASATGSAGSGAVRQRLGGLLKELREERQVTVDRAATFIERGRQTVWKIEHGKLDVNIRPYGDVGRLCDLYEVDDETRRGLVGLAEQTKVKGWFQPDSDILPPNFDVYLGLEETTEQIQWYDSNLVPGLMQTDAYARSIISSVGSPSAEEIERRLKLRLRRQGTLQREQPVRLDVVLYEGVLRCTVGGPEAMADQLSHINALGELPNVRIRIIPFNAGAHAGMTSGPFEILRFPEKDGHGMPPMVYVDGFTGGLWFKEKEVIDKYEDAFSAVRDRSVSEVASKDLISKIVKEYSRA